LAPAQRGREGARDHRHPGRARRDRGRLRRLKSKITDADEMTLDTRSSKTVRVKK